MGRNTKRIYTDKRGAAAGMGSGDELDAIDELDWDDPTGDDGADAPTAVLPRRAKPTRASAASSGKPLAPRRGMASGAPVPRGPNVRAGTKRRRRAPAGSVEADCVATEPLEVERPAPSPKKPARARADRAVANPRDKATVAPNAPRELGMHGGRRVAARAHGAKRCASCGTHYSGHVRFCPFDGEPLSPAPDWDPTSDPLVGRVVSERFEVEAVIAEGGMGTVYRVRHIALGSVFAMKVLRRDLADDHEVAARLVDEARATAAIGHPNIVGVTDFGNIGKDVLPDLVRSNLPYFVMELVSGDSFADLIRDEVKLSPARTVHIIKQVAAALGAAHAVGIIHRDLKPDNIHVGLDDDGREMAKVLDFGVAKIIGSSKKTQAGMVFGTPHYMSPEQGQGHAIDQRTDVYALGVLMYECLTGTVPFAADTYMGVVTKHMFAKPQPLAELDPELAGTALEAILMRCLEKDPNDRYDTMAELCDDLASLEDGTQKASPQRASSLKLRDEEPDERQARQLIPRAVARDQRIWVAAAAVMLAIAAALVVVVAVKSPDAEAPTGGQPLGNAPQDAPDKSEIETAGARDGKKAGSTDSDVATVRPDSEPSQHAARPPRGSLPTDGASASGDDAAPVEVRGGPAPTQKGRLSPARRPEPLPPPPAVSPPSPSKTQPAGDVVDPWSQ